MTPAQAISFKVRSRKREAEMSKPQQPAEASGVVARLRELGSEHGPFRISRFELLTAADELEALQRRVAELEAQRSELCKLVSVIDSKLQSREPVTAEVDWDALGKVGHVFDSGIFADPCEWEELDEGTRENYIESAKSVIAAYEQRRPREKSDV